MPTELLKINNGTVLLDPSEGYLSLLVSDLNRFLEFNKDAASQTKLSSFQGISRHQNDLYSTTVKPDYAKYL